MARMHARKHGKSGSTRLHRMEKPQWVAQTPEEIESAVVELHKAGNSTALIGLKLRDSHGIPNVKMMTGKSVTEILVANDVKDLHNKRAMQLTEAKIRRLERYYKKSGIIPEKWKYSMSTAKLELE